MVAENHHDCEQIYFTIEVFFSQEDSVFPRFSSGFFMQIHLAVTLLTWQDK